MKCVSFIVPSVVPVIGQAQVVQRPSSPHASEVEPSVDEVANIAPRDYWVIVALHNYKDCMYVLYAVPTSHLSL